LHPLQHAGLARRTSYHPRLGNYLFNNTMIDIVSTWLLKSRRPTALNLHSSRSLVTEHCAQAELLPQHQRFSV
jgi:hypothetical protein